MSIHRRAACRCRHYDSQACPLRRRIAIADACVALSPVGADGAPDGDSTCPAAGITGYGAPLLAGAVSLDFFDGLEVVARLSARSSSSRRGYPGRLRTQPESFDDS